MSDKMRWRYGDTNPVVAAVDSATVIEIGDLLWQDTDDAKPASDQNDHGTEAADQEIFADKFLGVAMQRSRSGNTAPIRVATTGVFEFECPLGTYELGQRMAVADGHGGELFNHRVLRNNPHAIGRVARREPSAITSVLVDIRSTVMTGGIEGSTKPGG